MQSSRVLQLFEFADFLLKVVNLRAQPCHHGIVEPRVHRRPFVGSGLKRSGKRSDLLLGDAVLSLVLNHGRSQFNQDNAACVALSIQLKEVQDRAALHLAVGKPP